MYVLIYYIIFIIYIKLYTLLMLHYNAVVQLKPLGISYVYYLHIHQRRKVQKLLVISRTQREIFLQWKISFIYEVEVFWRWFTNWASALRVFMYNFFSLSSFLPSRCSFTPDVVETSRFHFSLQPITCSWFDFFAFYPIFYV